MAVISTAAPDPDAPAGAGSPGRFIGGTVDIMPLSGRLTSRFGTRRHPVTGGLRHHAGIDIAAPHGSPVQSTGTGIVRRAGWAGGYGLLIVIDHGNGTETRYAHLSGVAVAPGQQVGKGNTIGYVGSTGRSTGPHLHYEIRESGRARDPLAR